MWIAQAKNKKTGKKVSEKFDELMFAASFVSREWVLTGEFEEISIKQESVLCRCGRSHITPMRGTLRAECFLCEEEQGLKSVSRNSRLYLFRKKNGSFIPAGSVAGVNELDAISILGKQMLKKGYKWISLREFYAKKVSGTAWDIIKYSKHKEISNGNKQ